MNKEQIQKAFSYIHESEDFNEKTIKLMKEKVIETKQIGGKRNVKRILSVGLATAACLAFMILAISRVMSENQKAVVPNESSGQVASVATDTSVQETGREKDTLKLDGTPVNYSTLNFAETENVKYLDVTDTMNADILPFLTANVLANATDVVIKATISDIHFNGYSYVINDPDVPDDSYKKTLYVSSNTIVYEVNIDKVYYKKEGLSVSVGDTFYIEDPLWTESCCLSDSVFRLNINRQYLLPVHYVPDKEGSWESPYSLSYNYIPQIECTKDGGYVFYVLEFKKEFVEHAGNTYKQAGWVELKNEDTVSVIMDQYEEEGHKEELTGRMFIRADDDFESDFQSLIDKWCK
ncbi:MAG: hypothetical protein Q8O09_00230 [Bacillota bacterium]|nr:hypothetical protein [Bacillota bacterium]